MRRIFSALAVSLLFSVPLLGQETHEAEPLAYYTLDADATMRLVERINRRVPAGERSANATWVEGAVPGFVIAAAGDSPGGGGTYFRSDVTLVNYDTVPQLVAVIWAPRSVTGVGGQAKVINLPPNQAPVTTRNLVSQLGFTGLGSLVFLPVDSGGNQDEVASIDGTSRIWTPLPAHLGVGGTTAQPFPGVGLGALFGKPRAVVMGMRQDADFRTNALIVNLDTFARTWRVTVFGSNNTTAQFDVTVQPLSMRLEPISAGTFGDLSLRFDVLGGNANFGWFAFGSSVDNITGDAWSSNASIPFTPSDLE
jgi:hypothetical protein